MEELDARRMSEILVLLFFAMAVPLLLLLWASGGRDPRSWPIRVESPQGAKAPVEGARRLRVVTYNVGYGSGRANNLRLIPPGETRANLERMRGFLEESGADFAFLQEVDFRSRRSGDLDQSAFLAGSHFFHAVSAVTWDKRHVPFPSGPPSRNFGRILSGQSILSRGRVARAETRVLEKPAENGFLRNAFYLDRLALVAEVGWGVGSLVLVNVHLEAFIPRARVRQARELREYLEKWRGRPLIVAGDFNACAADETLGILREGGFLSGAPAPEGLPTFPSWAPVEDLDHVLVGQGVSIRSRRTIDVAGTPSDHLPVLVELEL